MRRNAWIAVARTRRHLLALGNHEVEDATVEWQGPGERLEQHNPVGVPIALLGEISGVRLLGRHVRWRTRRRSLFRQSARLLAQIAHEAKVQDHHAASRNHHIAGLQVAMQHTSPVKSLNAPCKLAERADQLVHRRAYMRNACHAVARNVFRDDPQVLHEGLSCHVFHRDEPPVLRAAELVQLDQVRVTDVCKRAELPLEAENSPAVYIEEALDGHLAAGVQVASQIDHAHGAFP